MRGLSRSFHTRACSRPPEPITRIFIAGSVAQPLVAVLLPFSISLPIYAAKAAALPLAALRLADCLGERRDNLKQITHYTISCHFEDRRFTVFVDGKHGA